MIARSENAALAPRFAPQHGCCACATWPRVRRTRQPLRVLPVLDDELQRRLAPPFVDLGAIGGARWTAEAGRRGGTGSRRSVRRRGRARASNGSRRRSAGRAPKTCRRRAGRETLDPRLGRAARRRARSPSSPGASVPSESSVRARSAGVSCSRAIASKIAAKRGRSASASVTPGGVRVAAEFGQDTRALAWTRGRAHRADGSPRSIGPSP